MERYALSKGDGGKQTHTSMFGVRRSYHVPEADMRTFWSAYQRAVREGQSLHLTEAHFEQGPFVIDVDLKYTLQAGSQPRVYTEQDVQDVLRVYNAVILQFLDVPPDQFVVYVMEKPAPTLVEDNQDAKTRTYKDGVHIIYPEVCASTMLQHLVRELFLAEAKKQDLLGHLGLINTLDDVFDKAVIERNNWLLYGSGKDNDANKRYKLTHVWDFDFVENPLEEVDWFNLPKYLSVRKFKDTDHTALRTGMTRDKIREMYDSMQAARRKGAGSQSGRTAYSEVDVRRAQMLVDMLNPRRADAYNAWIELGFCLHNIDQSLLSAWVDFSTHSKKFKEGECERLWAKFRCEGLGIGSLHRWAKDDSPERYATFLMSENESVLKHSLNGTSYRIAHAFYEMNKFSYVCASIKHKKWYEFKNHRWCEMDEAKGIMTKLNEELSTSYIKLGMGLANTAAMSEGDERESVLKKSRAALNIADRLCRFGFKIEIVKELQLLYHDDTFLDKLDENRHYMCFTNGVYDFNAMAFREGRPEDYISMCTHIPYQPIDRQDEKVANIERLFQEIQPEPEMRSYVLDLLASFLQGQHNDQKFHIWTGSGCHAIDTAIMMADGTVKKVQDVSVGDKLMGDDGTHRNVLELFRGTDAMYKITAVNGETFTVNGEHKLALKATTSGCVSGCKRGHMIYWLQYDERRVPGVQFREFAGAGSLARATRYLEERMQDDNVIKKGDVVSVMVKDYVRLPPQAKRRLLGFKARSRFEPKDVVLDPYTLGYQLGDGEVIINDIKGAAKHIPHDFKCNDEQVQLQVLAGLIDACGQYDERCNQYEVTLDNERLVDDVTFLARSLGFGSFKRATQQCFAATIYGQGLDRVPVLCPRNVAAKRHDDRDDLMFSFKVEEAGFDAYYGYEVDKNHCYLMGDHTATFNSNGKSLIIKLYYDMLGDYANTVSTTLITAKRVASNAATPELAKTKGRRFIAFHEPENDDAIQVGNMKALTGCDKIQARPMYGEPIEFYPQFKTVLACNRLPMIPSNDGGTWRRIRVVPFETKFVDDPRLPHERKINRKLGDEMATWKVAFMGLLIDRFSAYKIRGLQEPAKVMMYTHQYQRNSDMILEFMNEFYDITDNPDDLVEFGDMFNNFKVWNKDSAYAKRFNKTEFKMEVEDKMGKVTNKAMVKGLRYKTDTAMISDFGDRDQKS